MNAPNAKLLLYQRADALRKLLRLPDSAPADLPAACAALPWLAVEAVPFDTPGLRGMAAIGEKGVKDVILLRAGQSPRERSFACGHELVHLCLHRTGRPRSFTCFDLVTEHQDPFLEWEANEGSAELHLPYAALLPFISARRDWLDDWRGIVALKRELASSFSVTDAVVHIRLESLKYEIEQYLSGVPLDAVRLLSATQQTRLGIRVRSLNEREDAGRREACAILLRKPETSAVGAQNGADDFLKMEEKWLYDI